jgi:GNAT superfamily N-acetyltransferase
MKLTLHHFDGPSLPECALADGVEILAPAGESPDARIYLMDGLGDLRAQAALWWRETPLVEGQRIGAIGGFAASGAGPAEQVLAAARTRLKAAGCQMAVGPMNGNTWRRHRLVIESNGRGPFLLEPRNPIQDPAWWLGAGFSVLSQDSSSVTPLDEVAFLDAYRKIRPHVDPDLVRIATRNGAVCRFVFGIRDLEAAGRGDRPALIVKTLAVDPDARCAGLGSLLVDELHQIGREKGYIEAIHALQHETNTSLKITGRHQGECFRRYVLFSQ